MSPRRGLYYGLMVALAAVACAPGATNNTPASTVHGGNVSVVGVWAGAELDSFNAVIAPFQDKTGIKVTFEGARDQDAILSTRVSAGNPPDLAAAPSPSLLTRFAQQGKVVDLSKVVDTTQLNKDYAKSWIDLGTVNGKLVQVFSWAALKGLIWYDPKVWTAKGYQVPKTWTELLALQAKIKADGTTPWCMAVESGGDTGWAGSDFHKEIALGQVGPTVYDKWWQGKQKWTSPEIKSTWTSFGQVLGSGTGNIYGGSSYVVNTNFGEVGNHMFTNPPGCYMLNQASFITDFFVKANSALKPGVDFNFFSLPEVNTANAGSHVVAADAWSMFKDTPQARALIQYLITPEAQAIWVKRGGKLSPNKRVSLSDYPDDQTKAIAQLLLDTKIGRYDAGDLMPSDMKHAYWSGILDFIRDPTKLDAILTQLDKVQATAYTAA